MNTKAILGFITATVIALLAVNFAMAGDLPVSIEKVKVNDVELSSGISLAGNAGESVPVTVVFDSSSDLDDVKVRVWIEGYKSDIYASTGRFNTVNGSTYIKKLSLTLPDVEDMDDLTEGLTLYVRVSDRTDEVETSYSIAMQRDSYVLRVLSLEVPLTASAGEIIPIDVVLKNIGAEESEDTFVTASIPELAVYKKAYYGDLTPEDVADPDKEDARAGRLYLVIPSDAKTGEYDIEVRASNYDASVSAKKRIAITGAAVSDTGKNVIDATTGDKKEGGMSTSVIVLTAVLVVIFVVLLIVLIVLLTKKPSEKAEDFGETSYY